MLCISLDGVIYAVDTVLLHGSLQGACHIMCVKGKEVIKKTYQKVLKRPICFNLVSQATNVFGMLGSLACRTENIV